MSINFWMSLLHFISTNVPVDQALSSLPWISLPASQVISLPPVFILIFFSAEFSSWRKMWSHHSLFKTSYCFLFISVKKQTKSNQHSLRGQQVYYSESKSQKNETESPVSWSRYSKSASSPLFFPIMQLSKLNAFQSNRN